MGARDVAVAVLCWAAACVQAVLVLFFLTMGLGWGGVLHLATVVQGAVLLAVAAWLSARRRLLVLLVPVVSAGIALGLVQTDAALTARACSPAARAALDELGAPSSLDESLVLGFPDSCQALYDPGRPFAGVVEQYRRAAGEAGWDVTREEVDTIVVGDDDWTVQVVPYRLEDGLVVLRVSRRED